MNLLDKKIYDKILGSDNMKFKLNDYIINYEVIRKDNKNLYFRIDENCNLIITAPKFITDTEIKNLITKYYTQYSDIVLLIFQDKFLLQRLQ